MTKQELQNQEFLNTYELFILYDIKKSTQAQLRFKRKIPFIKQGKFIKYKNADIKKWLDDNRVDVIE
jgi:hypothetical protein